jgi:hypothetical protein
MPCVEFEPTITASEGAKTVYVLDRWTTVTGYGSNKCQKLFYVYLDTFFLFSQWGVESNWVHSARRPLIGLL